VALLAKATYRPSALIAGACEGPLPVRFGEDAERLTRVVVPATMSRRKTSSSKGALPSSCPGIRLRAELTNGT
jgi:hypothetical protein